MSDSLTDSVTATDRPRLSIGLPVYNGERYLPAALAGLLSQDFTDFELIISDNASTDRTEDMCRAFAATDSRIRYHRNQSNLGAAANYNNTVRMARGELFKWAAHDDVCLPGYLSACVERLNDDDAIVLCHTLSLAIDNTGRQVGRYDREPDAMMSSCWQRFAKMMLTPHYCIPVFGVVRLAILEQTPRHGDWVGADRNLLAELALHGRIALVDRELFQRRHHAESSIAKLPNERQRAAWFKDSDETRTYPTWRRLKEYAASIKRAPINPLEKLRCYVQLPRWVFGRHHAGERNLKKLWREMVS